MSRKLALGLLLTVFALAVSASIAYAAVIGPDGMIHACYTNQALRGSHALVLQDVGTNCPTGTTAISWNQQGQPGQQGAQGPQGQQGAQGPQGAAGPSTAGPSGLDVLTLSTTATGKGSVMCPADHPYLVGGFAIDDTAAAPAVFIPNLPPPPPPPAPPARANGVFAQLAPGSNPNDVLAIWALCSK